MSTVYRAWNTMLYNRNFKLNKGINWIKNRKNQKDIQNTQTYTYIGSITSHPLIKTSIIKTIPGTAESQPKTQGVNQDILSDLRDTKQTQTQFMEMQNKLPTLESVENESKEIEEDKQSKEQVINMEEIEEMISGSGLDFGKKVKSDYMHSGISDIPNSEQNQKNDIILNNINAESAVYDKKKSEGWSNKKHLTSKKNQLYTKGSKSSNYTADHTQPNKSESSF